MELIRINFFKLMLIVLSMLLVKEVLFSSRSIVLDNVEVAQAAEIEPQAALVENVVTDTTDVILQRVGSKYGVDWKLLKAMMLKESGGDCKAIGDQGMGEFHSVGCFQINKKYNPAVTYEQATDLAWSADWTAARLAKFAYLGEFEQIRSHNGLVASHSNDYYVYDVMQIMQNL